MGAFPVPCVFFSLPFPPHPNLSLKGEGVDVLFVESGTYSTVPSCQQLRHLRGQKLDALIQPGSPDVGDGMRQTM